MRVVLVSLVVLAAALVEGARHDRAGALFSADDDAALLDGDAGAAALLATAARAGAAGGAAGALDVTSLSALRDAISDDLSSDSSALSDTLDRLLTGSTADVDESDAVSGEAFGDEPKVHAQVNVPSAVDASGLASASHSHSDAEDVVEGEHTVTEVTAAAAAPKAPPAPSPEQTSGIIPAPIAAPTTVTAAQLQRFRAVADTDATDPVTPLKGHNSKVAVPVPGPLPAHSDAQDLTADDTAEHGAAHGKAQKHKAKRAHAKETEEEAEEEEEAKDKPRFLAERALNRVIAQFSAQMTDTPLTPQQKALASQGGSDPALKVSTDTTASTADRIRTGVYVVLAIAGVIALVEASTFLTDYALKQSHVQIDRILSKTYKAMMLLGLVSFLAVCFARLNWMSKVLGDYSPNFLYDLLIVMGVMGLLYLVVMCGLVGYVLYSAAQYRTIELKHPTEGDLTRLENALTKQRDEYNARSCCTRTFASCFAQYNLRQTEFEVQYLQIKQQFVRQHHRRFLAPYTAAAAASTVPPTPSEVQASAAGAVASSPPLAYQRFEFHVYLRKAMQQGMEEVAAVHWQVWCVIFAVVLVNALRMLVFKSVEASSFVYISVILLWVVMIYSAFLAYSVSNATEQLAEQYTLYLPERDARDVETPSDDPDDEMLRESHMVQGGGCCGKCCQCCQGCRRVECCSAPSKQQTLFWCQTPSSVTKGVQVAVLLTCLIIPAYIVDMADLMTSSNMGVRYAINILLFVPPIVLLLFLIPAVLPRFLIATAVASMSRLTVLRATVVKLNSTAYKAAKFEADKQRAAARGKAFPAPVASGGVASLNTDFDDDRAGSEEDDDDSDLDNDTKSMASRDVENPNAMSLGGAPLLGAARGDSKQRG